MDVSNNADDLEPPIGVLTAVVLSWLALSVVIGTLALAAGVF